MIINKIYGENASGHIPRIVVGILALVIVMAAYTGVVGAQGMDVTLNPTEGAPGTQVTANGSNWPAGHTINVTWEIPYTGLGNVIVDNNGNFVITFLVPSTVATGQHNVFFNDIEGRTFNVKIFTVTPPPPPPPPVSTFNISGFKINNATGSGVPNWNITLTNSTLQKSMLTGADGSYIFMNLVNGTYNVAEETKTGWTSVSPISQQVTINGADIMNINFTNQPTTQTPPPTVHITANPDTHDINVSTNFTFTANPVGSWGNNISYSWSVTTEKCVTADFVLTGQSIPQYLDVACGNATISVTAEDEKKNNASDTYLVTVHENTNPIPTTPEPIQTTPVPTETTPVPTQTTPVPTETTPTPTETTPVPTVITPTPTETVTPPEDEAIDIFGRLLEGRCKLNGFDLDCSLKSKLSPRAQKEFSELKDKELKQFGKERIGGLICETVPGVGNFACKVLHIIIDPKLESKSSAMSEDITNKTVFTFVPVEKNKGENKENNKENENRDN